MPTRWSLAFFQHRRRAHRRSGGPVALHRHHHGRDHRLRAAELIRDVLVAEVPLIFRQSELYVTACLAGIIAYFLLAYLGIPAAFTQPGHGAVLIAVIRILSIRWNIVLPVLQIPPHDGGR